MILDLAQLLNMNSSGLEALGTLHRTLRKRGSTLILSGIREQPMHLAVRDSQYGGVPLRSSDYIKDEVPTR